MHWITRIATAMIVVAMMGLGVALPAQASVQSDFIAKLVPGAQELQRSTGIPTSVTIGMAALESGWGRSSMATSRVVDGKTVSINTLFNIKCTSTVSPYQKGCVPISTVEYLAGVPYTTVAQFRTYANWTDSMRDYGRLLTVAQRYKAAFQYTSNPDQFVTEVHKGGYATDPNYAQKVINIIERYKLRQYDVNATPVVTPQPAPVVTTAYPVYGRGAKGAGVRTLQSLLNIRGNARLAVDGDFGSLTQAAVRAWQVRNGLAGTGTADAATWRTLTPTVRLGARSNEVRQLQVELNAAGARLAVDGHYGPASQAAAREFQRKNSLYVDGVVGAITWAVLIRQ